MKNTIVSQALLFGTAALAFAGPQYVVTEIRVGKYAFTQPAAINSAGQVVGFAHNFYAYADNAKAAARWPVFPVTSFLYQNGTTAILTGLGGSAVTANAINDSGQIVGSSSPKNDSATHAFLSSAGTTSDLGTLGGTTSQASAINSTGLIAGSSELSGGKRTHAFLFSAGTMTDLGTLGGTYSSAAAINASGAVVGVSNLRGDKHSHAVLFSGGALTDLGTLGGHESSASGINASGQIVGSASLPREKSTHAFLYLGGSMIDLGPRGSDYSRANAIDSGGRIVGTFTRSHGWNTHAFVYAAGSLIDLNSLISRTTAWVLTEATAINDSGLIVGSGTLNNQSRAFLLAPIDTATPPPEITVAGGGRMTVHSRISLHGATAGSAFSVTYRVGSKGPYRLAHGAGTWKFTAFVQPGKNHITVIAHGPGGDSAPKKMTIVRS